MYHAIHWFGGDESWYAADLPLAIAAWVAVGRIVALHHNVREFTTECDEFELGFAGGFCRSAHASLRSQALWIKLDHSSDVNSSVARMFEERGCPCCVSVQLEWPE